MRKILLILFISFQVWGCKDFSFERLANVPVKKEGKLQIIPMWGDLPQSLNVNSYDLVDLRVTSKSKINLDFKVEFLNDEKVISTTSASVKRRSNTNIGTNFSISYNRAVEQRANKMKLILSKYGKSVCEKEVRIWSGD